MDGPAPLVCTDGRARKKVAHTHPCYFSLSFAVAFHSLTLGLCATKIGGNSNVITMNSARGTSSYLHQTLSFLRTVQASLFRTKVSLITTSSLLNSSQSVSSQFPLSPSVGVEAPEGPKNEHFDRRAGCRAGHPPPQGPKVPAASDARSTPAQRTRTAGICGG